MSIAGKPDRGERGADSTGRRQLPYYALVNDIGTMAQEELEPDSVVQVKSEHDEEGELTVGFPGPCKKRFRVPKQGVDPVTPQSARRAKAVPVTASGDEAVRLLPLVEPTKRLPELVLTESVRDQVLRLLDLVQCDSDVRQLESVYGAGAERGGVTAVFEGPPGNGKTSVVHAIANEVGARLLRAGTTETGSSYHNVGALALRDAFDFCNSARESVLLLIDDGDDLIGTRGESTSARFMDSEVAALLQSIEANPGAITFITTNLAERMDQALRSRSTVVRFGAPTRGLRQELVRRLVRSDRMAPDICLDAAVVRPLSLREVAGLCHEVVRAAAKRHLESSQLQVIRTEDFDHAFETVVGKLSTKRRIGYRHGH